MPKKNDENNIETHIHEELKKSLFLRYLALMKKDELEEEYIEILKK